MQILESIPFSNLPFHSRLVKDYLSEKPELKPFYQHAPSIAGMIQATLEKQFSLEKRAILYAGLMQQYEGISPSGKVLQNIEALKNEQSFTVTTGHQLCVYGGPAYFMYKIASVINLAQQLEKAAPDKKFIPVFWMASEDHDFEEISEVHFYGKKWKWESEDENFGKAPVGRLSPQNIVLWAEEMKVYFRSEPNVCDMLTIFEQAYKECATLADATRKILNELFADSGLVVIDGDDPALKKMFEQVLIDEISNRRSHRLVEETTDALKSLGYAGQIVSRDVNLFYLNVQGQRLRIDYSDAHFKIPSDENAITLDHLLEEVKGHPERFSPNVVLRPVYQECIMPNIAYIGGPAEVAYWLQLQNVFKNFNIPFPVVIPRASVVSLFESTYQKIQTLGMSLTSFLSLSADDLVKHFIKENQSEEISFEQELAMVSNIIASLQMKAKSTDPQLQTQVAIEEKQMIESINRVQAKFNKAIKQKFDGDIKSIQRIKSQLFPEQTGQERIISFFDCYEFRQKSFAHLINLSNPLENHLKVTLKHF